MPGAAGNSTALAGAAGNQNLGPRPGGNGGGSGAGAAGGNGATGGYGGAGGNGRPGVPGMLKLQGTMIRAKGSSGGTVNALNGPGTSDPTMRGMLTFVGNNTNYSYNNTNKPNGIGARCAWGMTTNYSVLRRPNPYVVLNGQQADTPTMGELVSGPAAVSGWLKADYWNKADFASVTGGNGVVKSKVLNNPSLNFSGFAQVIVRNTGAETVTGVGVRTMVYDGTAYAISARLLQGAGQDPGTLLAGQDWTMALPALAGTPLATVVYSPTITAAPTSLLAECGMPFGKADLLAGISASDAEDGTITDRITLSGDWPVPVNVPGTYTVKFDVTDSDGFVAPQVSRTITVQDTQAPVIVGVPRHPASFRGTPFTLAMAFNDIGAQDSCSGSITGITVEAFNGAVKLPFSPSEPILLDSEASYPLTLTLKYTVQDAAHNVATVQDTLDLFDIPPPVLNLLGANPVTVECKTAYVDAGATA